MHRPNKKKNDVPPPPTPPPPPPFRPYPQDVSSESSVRAAAASLSHKLGTSGNNNGNDKLYAIVNNAGTGIAHGSPISVILDTNVRGPRRVVDNFLPLLDPNDGRIVNVGSGAGPMFVSDILVDPREKSRYVGPMDNNEIEEGISRVMNLNDDYAAYAGSKALLACYTMSLARQHPNLSISILTPGYIKTNMTRGYGATKTPSEGTVALRKCLFDDLGGMSGYFWGSDGLRSPLHYLRHPGDPEYNGEAPTF
jgi:carbonyl reductase 1